MNTLEMLQELEAMGVQTNATPPMGTGKTGEGAELVPSQVFMQEVFDMVPAMSKLMGMLPGNHSANGRRLPKVATVPLLGEAPFFSAGSEKTSGAFAVSAGTTAPTGEITITQKKYTLKFDVTEDLDTFSEYPEELKTALQERIGKSMARTLEATIINADAETGATGNVNTDDQLPVAGSYFLGADHGIRELAINNSYGVNVGALSISDFTDVMAVLGDYGADPEDCLWIFNRKTYLKAMSLSDFADASKAGKEATTSSGAMTNVFGSDLIVGRDVNLTEADGKMSGATPGDNTLGQFLYIWKPAVQFGFGKDLQIKILDFGSDGYQLHAWYHFGFGIFNKDAGATDPAVAVGYNVTV